MSTPARKHRECTRQRAICHLRFWRTDGAHDQQLRWSFRFLLKRLFRNEKKRARQEPAERRADCSAGEHVMKECPGMKTVAFGLAALIGLALPAVAGPKDQIQLAQASGGGGGGGGSGSNAATSSGSGGSGGSGGSATQSGSRG